MNAPTSPDAFRRFAASRGSPAVRSGRIGVLLVNLGTPEATDYWSMRRYLKEFLSDRRVIETPRWIVVADPQSGHPDATARRQGPRLRPRSGTASATRAR